MKKLSVPMKLGYATGGMAFSVKDTAFINFVLFYYTQVVGLSGKQTGFVLMIAMMWDAVSDPIIGSFSDNFRSRWGRRHPFMALGGAPYAFTFLALFFPPMHWSQSGKFWWFLITCLLLRTFLTVFIIPHTSLAPELSGDYQERTSIIGYRTVMGWLNGVFLYFFAMKVFLRPVQGADGAWMDGRLVADSYYKYGILSCILVLLYTTTATVSTRRFIPRLRTAAGDARHFSLVQILRDFRWALGNHDFRILCLMLLTAATAVGVQTSLNLMMGTYFWELTASQLAWVSMVQAIGATFTFLLLRPLGSRFDKHRLISVCYLMFGLNGLWLVGGRLLGVLPENGDPLIYRLVILNAFITVVFTLLVQVMISSFTADIVDQQELDRGRRQEGVFYAVEAFAGKAVTGLGNMLGGLIIDAVAFPTYASLGRVPTVDDVSPGALFRLGLIVGPVLATTYLIPFGLSLFLRLSRQRHDEIRLELGRRPAPREEVSGTDAPS